MSRHVAPRRHRQASVFAALTLLTVAAIITAVIFAFLWLGWERWLIGFGTYLGIVAIVIGLARSAGVEPPERESESAQ